MRVSFSWLKELVSLDMSPQRLADMLTVAGVEVESIEVVKPEFERVAVGRILNKTRHPNADKLVLCEVDVGGAQPLKIVCGAANMNEGDKVAVALIGAGLAGGLKVKKAKIRDEVSEGMMCSKRELGLGDDHLGIMILPPEAVIGQSLDEFLGLGDIILDLAVTANRPDCLSMLGVAREVAAISRARMNPPRSDVREEGPDIASLTSVTIDDSEMCPRYAARVVRDVKTGPSPAWLQNRLLKAGLRPLSNIVDATNYVLIELGHPLHAFDYSKLAENRIVVRRARMGETIVTLDGGNRELTDRMLVIADAERPAAIAGVMGGAASEVTETTKHVLIESAYFDPASIRRTSKALGLSTEASYRFERGADPEMVLTALDRAAALMAELTGGTIARGRIDCYPRKSAPVHLTLRHKRVKKIVGVEIPFETSLSILESVGMKIVARQPETATVLAPSYRPDIKAEIDLIEEIARIHGYEKIEPTYPGDSTVMERGLQPPSLEDECRSALRRSGFSEVITFSFGAPADMADLSDGKSEPIKLRNPLTEDASVLRMSLIPGLLHTIRTNFNLGNKALKLFEVGKIYRPAASQTLPDERSFACAVATGNARPLSWRTPPEGVDFFDLKGVAETLLKSLGCASPKCVKAAHRGFHPGICADVVVAEKRVGRIGEIHPDILKKHDFNQKVCVFEIDISLLEACPRTARRCEKISRFPYSDRDMAVVVDEQVEAAALISAITAAGGNILRHALLFDVYRGRQVDENKKSLAFSLRFQSDERTLTDEEITAVFAGIVADLERRFGAKLRA